MKRRQTLILARTVMLLFVMLCSVVALADDITAEQAQHEALAFLQKQRTPTGRPRYAPGKMPKLRSAQKVSGLYVFNVDNNGGFVVVSNDDGTIPILGFSDSGNLDPDNMPANMRAWLQGYADEIAWFKENVNGNDNVNDNGNGKARRRVGSHDTDEIKPLMTTTWNQGYPYNALCPEYATGQKSVTGCVATAMAQVMYYTETKAKNETTATKWDISNYKTNRYKIDMPAIPEGTVISWKDMITDYSGNFTSANATAVAQLMLYCGCAVEMDYGPTSFSNTVNVVNALKRYFGYSETVKYLCRSWYSYDNWTDIIYHELEEGRPVVYGGSSIDGGHEFVCDGYKQEDDTDYFHINWGWGGQSDNYFVLSVLDPLNQGIGGSSSNSAYDYGQDAAVGIQKIGGTGTVLERDTYNFGLQFNSITASCAKIALGESVDITVNVSNLSDMTYDGDLYLTVNDRLGVGKTFVIPNKMTQDCTITFTPQEVGDYTIGIAYCNPNPGDEPHAGMYYFVYSPKTTLTVVDQTPTNVTVSHVTRETATINWTNVGEATEWSLSYWPLNITTEDFNGNAEDIFKAGNWTTFDGNKNDASWVLAPGEGINGSQCVKSASYMGGQNVDPFVFLVSPKIKFSSEVSFWAWGSTNGVENFSVWISTDGSYYQQISEVYTTSATPKQYTFDLEPYVEEGSYDVTQGYIAIAHMNSTGSTSESYLYVDDVTIMTIAGGTTQINTIDHPLIMEGLAKQQAYEVKLQAFNSNGGKWSDPVIFATTDDRFSLADNDSELPTKNQEHVEAWNGMTTEVTLTGRTLYKDGDWNTLCLPFAVSTTSGPLSGDNVKAMVLRPSDSGLSGTTLTLNFDDAPATIPAGTPFIVKWDNTGVNITDPVFTNVTISDANPNVTSDDHAVQFQGTYGCTDIYSAKRDNLFLGTANELFYPWADNMEHYYLGACRAYFHLDFDAVGGGGGHVKTFVLNFGDENDNETTVNSHLSTVNSSNAGAVYNLSGQRLSKLQKGINIINGKKVLK